MIYCCCWAGCCARSTMTGGSGVAALFSFSCSRPSSSIAGARARPPRAVCPGVALVHAAHRRHIAVVASVGDAHVPQAHGLAQRRIEAHPAGIRQINFRPGVRCVAADHFLQFRVGRCRAFRHQIAGDVARRASRACAPRPAAGARNPGRRRPNGERILDRRIDVRRALHVLEISRESESEAACANPETVPSLSVAGRVDQFVELRQMRHVSGGRDESPEILLPAPRGGSSSSASVIPPTGSAGARAPAPRIPPRSSGGDARAEY